MIRPAVPVEVRRFQEPINGLPEGFPIRQNQSPKSSTDLKAEGSRWISHRFSKKSAAGKNLVNFQLDDQN
jgi:hypothetical protein